MDTRDKVRLNCKRGVRKAYFDEHRGDGRLNCKSQSRVMGTQKDQNRLNRKVNLGIKNFFRVEQPWLNCKQEEWVL